MADGGAAGAEWDAWAEYYDLSTGRRAPELIDFYGSLIEPRTQSVLDLGCGTGTITTALADRLADRGSGQARVVGLDLSEKMLRVARSRDRRVEWVEGDMRSPSLSGEFDLVIASYHTFQSLLEDDDLARALTAARSLARPDGRLAFDVYQPSPSYLTDPPKDRVAGSMTDPEGRRVELREDFTYDPSVEVLTIDWRLIDVDDPAAPVAAFTYRMRQYFPDVLDRILERAGWTVRERYGDLDRSPFTASSMRQVLVCEA
jgi:SAM-dependent methyltransferase